MLPRLLERLSSRFVFVIGKGGVGKSTTASAVALGLADSGEETHLISTDPAHSLGDLFDQSLVGGGPTTSSCSARLTLEELDVTARARRWFEAVGDAAADLLYRGTYLDRDDIATLLDRSLPGIDEVMAALRIAELGKGDSPRRVVVDTAPTGHTLRLLDSGETLSGWVTAFDALAQKAGAVVTGLTGRRIRFEGEVVIDELRADVTRFSDAIVKAADFVIVTRDGDVVRAETERLAARLRDRGLRIAARVTVCRSGGKEGERKTAASDPDELDVPYGHGMVGCAGLRRWGEDRAATAGARSSAPEPTREGRGPCPDLFAMLPPRALMLFAGKGGVGKSTCAAAYALSLTDERSVLLLSLDPAGSLADVLERPVGADVAEVTPRLFAVQIDAEREFERFRVEYRVRVQAVFQRLGLDRAVALDRRVLESLLDMAPPGLDEIFALDAMLEGADEHDLLVVDSAPTGHFLRLLEMPGLALSWTRAVLRVLLKYRAVLGLDDFARDLLDVAKRLKRLGDQLEDPERSGVVVVTLSERLARRETERLLERLRRGGTPVAAVMVNRWSASGTDGGEAELSTAAGDGRAAGAMLLAPDVSPAPVGPERLRGFVARWACP